MGIPSECKLRHHRPIHRLGCCLLVVLTFSLSDSAFSAGPGNGDTIDLLRDEIEVLEQRLNQAEAGKQGIIRQLQDNDRKIELHRRVVRELEQQTNKSRRRLRHLKIRIDELENQIADLSENLAVEEADLSDLRREAGERISQMYRRSSVDRLSLLLTSSSLNDLSQRQQYIKAVERFDRHRLDKLRRQRDRVWDDRQELVDVRQLLTLEQARRLSELERTRRLINSRRSEEKKLTDEKVRKQQLLEKIAGDSELLNALLEERRRSLQRIEWEIDRLEGRRPKARSVWQPDISFKQLAGKLPWPLDQKKVALPFGQNRHPELRTTTINPGIDLKASPDDPVYSVARGQVTKISWLRGFGNTVIISHGDGYYTVYARLGRIFVSENDVINQGQPIGMVGDSGAEGNFHFEVWSKRNKQDPLRWLE